MRLKWKQIEQINRPGETGKYQHERYVVQIETGRRLNKTQTLKDTKRQTEQTETISN